MRRVVVPNTKTINNKQNTVGKRDCQPQTYRKLSKINLKKSQDVDQYYAILM